MRRLLLLAAIAALAVAAPAARAAHAVPIALGRGVVALDGPWKFRTGDDPRWSAQNFDDTRWESVNLTPEPGAHDGDVGLRNYVAGWGVRGHRGYTGIAWYRIGIRIAGTQETLRIVGPALVDNAYQLFVNGHLLGGIGDPDRNPPRVIAIQPRLYAVPHDWWTKDGDALTGVIAIRVAALKVAAAGPDGGGIHIAPLIGTAKGAGDHYTIEWLETVEGYAVDAVEAVMFLLLAIMALSLMPFDRRDTFYPWLALTLVLLAAARGNQPFFFLADVETYRGFVFWRLAVIDALTLAAWTMAWAACFRLRDVRWIGWASAVLAAAYMATRVLGTTVLMPSASIGMVHTFAQILQYVRYAFVALSVIIFARGMLRRALVDIAALVAMLSGAIGIFAGELSQLGVPGIWFPYGVGVSRTEYTYVVFDIALFVLLLLRLWSHAPGAAAGAPRSSG